MWKIADFQNMESPKGWCGPCFQRTVFVWSDVAGFGRSRAKDALGLVQITGDGLNHITNPKL